MEQQKKPFLDRFSENPNPYMNPYAAGIFVGIILFLGFIIMGKGLGASGAVTRSLLSFISLFAPEHAASAPYYQKYLGSTTSGLFNWLVFLFIGMAIGGFVSGMINRRMKTETFRGDMISDKKRLWMAFLGGFITFIGARMAGGCTSGHGLTGGSMLGVAGWIFMIGVFASGFITAFFIRKNWLSKE